MRVMVAGATSVAGVPLLRELNARGHEVVGLTRSSSKASEIEAAGGKPVVGAEAAQGFRAREEVWSTGASNLVGAAQRAGVRRIVAESVVFAYGYPTTGPAVMDETHPYPGPPPKGGDDMPAALRGMEQTVLSSGEHSDTEGIVLRYGLFYGRVAQRFRPPREVGRYRR